MAQFGDGGQDVSAELPESGDEAGGPADGDALEDLGSEEDPGDLVEGGRLKAFFLQ